MSLNCYPPERPDHNEGAMTLAIVLGVLLVIAMFGWYHAESKAEDLRHELNNEIYILKAKETTNEAAQA